MASLRLVRIERRRDFVAGVAERRSSSVTSLTRLEIAPVRRIAISRSADAYRGQLSGRGLGDRGRT